MLRDSLPVIVSEELPGPEARKMVERREASIPDAIKCVYPVVIKDAAGAMIEDVDGNRFVDWVGGVGVLNVGHCHPRVVAAVKEQADHYLHGMFNIVTHHGYVELAEELCKIVPVRGDKKRAFFANSGAEADENAVKIAKAYTKRPNIIVFSGAFHGRTMLTMAMTSKKSYAVGMGPFPDGVYRAEYPYLYRRPNGMTEAEAIQYYIGRLQAVFEESSPAEYVAAVVLEPLQGEGGFVPAPIEWVKAVRETCDRKGILLVADEVQSGFGRTGKMFASDYWAEAGCAPDIVATAKSIAGGMPLSAIIAREEIMQAVPSGTIGGTFCGNALACAAGIQVLQIIQEENLLDRGMEIGKKCRERFESWKEQYTVIGDVRGLGAMLGIEFVLDRETKEPASAFVADLVQECVKNGLIVESAGTYNNVIRFLAPLVITDEQLEAGLAIMEQAIRIVSDAHNIK